MAKDYSDAELLEIGRKMVERRNERAKVNKAHRRATAMLVNKYKLEFDKFVAKILKELD